MTITNKLDYRDNMFNEYIQLLEPEDDLTIHNEEEIEEGNNEE